MRRSFFHLLLSNAHRGRDHWDQYLFTVGCPLVLSLALFALDGPTYTRGVIALAIMIAFVVTLPRTDPVLQALRTGTPMQRAHASVMTGQVYGWRGRPKLMLFLAAFVLWVIGFAACMMQPLAVRLG